MPIRVEFFGIPRQRAGVSEVTLPCEEPVVRLEEVLNALEVRFPELCRDCLQHGGLRAGYTLNVRGERFARDPEELIRDGDTLLFMSTDAGG